MSVSRRTVLKGALGLAVVPLVGFTTDLRRARMPADPFTLGVASGEPAPDGVVLWTRLAPDPLADDGLGGMPPRSVEVEWEIATDDRFSTVEQRGVVTATPESAHSVHVEPVGLRPGADYFYRFRAEGFLSPSGRTRTAPAPDASATLTMCVASCSNLEHGWFTAYRRLAEETPDLVVHLGDYQYEFAGRDGGVRRHAGPETVTLADYRRRYAQYKTDPDLQAAHAVAPWLVVFDDHEVADNWADETPEQPAPDFPARRAAALRAYYENMPLRSSAMPHGAAMQLFRRVDWGALATFHMLDTRQYRSDQACGDAYRSDCRRTLQPAAVADRSGAGTMAAQRFSAVPGALGHPRPAGLLRATGPGGRPGPRDQPRRVGRLRGQPRPDRRRDRCGRRCATRSCSPATCTPIGPPRCGSVPTIRYREGSQRNW